MIRLRNFYTFSSFLSINQWRVFMKQKSKEEIFSLLIEDINKWVSECVFIYGRNMKGIYEMKGVRDDIWRIYSNFVNNPNYDEKKRFKEDVATQIVDVLNDATEKLLRENIQNNFFLMDLSIYKKQIEEKLSFVCSI